MLTRTLDKCIVTNENSLKSSYLYIYYPILLESTHDQCQVLEGAHITAKRQGFVQLNRLYQPENPL